MIFDVSDLHVDSSMKSGKVKTINGAPVTKETESAPFIMRGHKQFPQMQRDSSRKMSCITYPVAVPRVLVPDRDRHDRLRPSGTPAPRARVWIAQATLSAASSVFKPR